MGLDYFRAFATSIVANVPLMWIVPNNWTLAEAATVPCVYCTCLYVMLIIGKLKRGEKILIHLGTGGVGQAAINIALYYECEIFTTVSSEEKKNFILQNFPQIPECHIGNSRDTTFEKIIFTQTNGRGVDLVLNSLSEEKMLASLRCLAPYGRFLEIGKFDLQNNNDLHLGLMGDGKSFYATRIDPFFTSDSHVIKLMYNLLEKGIQTGIVKPLVKVVYNYTQIEEAFRLMAHGKHIGKILINLRGEQKQEQFLCSPRMYCSPEHCSVIVGGLGGFGMELANWLIQRGAKKIIFLSRNGISTGYQKYRIK